MAECFSLSVPRCQCTLPSCYLLRDNARDSALPLYRLFLRRPERKEGIAGDVEFLRCSRSHGSKSTKPNFTSWRTRNGAIRIQCAVVTDAVGVRRTLAYWWFDIGNSGPGDGVPNVEKLQKRPTENEGGEVKARADAEREEVADRRRRSTSVSMV